MTRYANTVVDQFESPVAGVQITVLDADGEVAVITDDDDADLLNPVATDAQGAFYFNAPEGTYTLQYRLSPTRSPFRVEAVVLNDDRALREDLSEDDGASLVIFRQPGTSTVARTLESRERESVSVLDFIPVAYHAAIRARTSTQDVTQYIQAGLNHLNTSTVGSFELFFPDGTYCISKSGSPTPARILEVQNGTKLRGASLEGTFIKVLPGSTATTLLEDSGNAAKIEISNMTLSGAGNEALTVILKLGIRGVQFGTWACVDNVTLREAPNAIACNFSSNIVVCGKIYTLETKSGLVSSGAGSGMHIETVTPTNFSDIGLEMSLADNVNFAEMEAPAADTAKPLVYERGGTLWNYFLAIGPGRFLRSPVVVNPTYVGDFVLGPTTLTYADGAPAETGTATSGAAGSLTNAAKAWVVDQWAEGIVTITGGTGAGQMRRVSSNTATTIIPDSNFSPAPDNTSQYGVTVIARYGDTANPDETGTATSGAAGSLTDTSKSWGLDQWKGGSVTIFAGTGAGQTRRVFYNSKSTLVPETAWSPAPDSTSQYKMSYFVRKSTDGATFSGGFGHSQTLTAYWPWFSKASVGDQLRANSVIVGASADARVITGILTVAATLDFASVSANSVGTPLTVTVRGAAVGYDVKVTPPAAALAQGIVYDAGVTATDTVTIYPKNLTGSGIDPASGSFTTTVQAHT